MKRRGAFTLPELLVYLGVLSVFTTALYAVLLLSIRHYRLSEARNQSTRDNLQALMQINRQLSHGADGTLQVQAQPPALLFLSAEPSNGTYTYALSGDGRLLWQKWVCLRYDSQTKKLIQHTKPITPTPDIPTAPTFAAMSGLSYRTVCRHVASFNLTQLDSKTVSYSIASQADPEISSRKVQEDRLLGSTTSGLLTLRN